MKSNSSKSGFALVIALSLMAFILLLLLSITALTQVETRSAVTAQSQTQAQMNALLGLQQALGELQATAGHDQRVTATGSLWENPEPGTEHYVGVWSSEDRDDDGEPDGTFQRWLVSDGDLNAREDVDFVNTAAPISLDGAGGYVATDPDYVLLVAEGSALQRSDNSGGIQGVAVKKVAVSSDNASGNFAWWVGDNGVKATVTQVDPYFAGLRTSTDWPANANTLSMQGTNAGGLDDFSQLDYSDADTIEKLLRTAALSDLQLVEGSVTSQVVKEHFHDLTTASMGLQTNTRHGGLKRDLSLLFEMSDADFDDPNGDFMTAMGAVTDTESGGAGVGGAGLVYDNPSSLVDAPWVEKSQQALIFKHPISGPASGDGVIYGPSFGMLRDYYRLYKGITNKDSQPILKEGWVHTYQPSKARVLANGNGSNSGSKAIAKARRYTLGMQGWRKRASDVSPETSSEGTQLANYWGGMVKKGESMYAIRPSRSSFTPYLSRLTNVFALTSELNPGSGLYDFDVIWQPYITLHNPYNVRVESQRMRYVTELRNINFKEIVFEEWDQTLDNGNGGYADPVRIERKSSLFRPDVAFKKNTHEVTWEGSEMILEIPGGVVFEPGEVKVFAINGIPNTPHGSPIQVALSDLPSGDTDGIHLNVKNQVSDLEGYKADTKIEIRFKIEKAGAHLVDIWNPELNNWDAMFSVKVGEFPQLYGNVKWDQGAEQLYRDRADSYESSAIASLVFDDYVKPLSFSENLGGGGPFQPVAENRKVYPNFMLTNPIAASFDKWASGTIEEFDWSGVFHAYAESFIRADGHPRSEIRDGSSRGSWGENHGSNGPSRCILFDLPTAPMQSIGQFQHAILHPMPYFAAKAVGNSFPSPFVAYDDATAVLPPNGISNTNADGIYYTFVKEWDGKLNEFCFYDFSYLLNDAIWDGYFFSSIAPTQSLMTKAYTLPSDLAGDEAAITSDIQKLVTDFVDGSEELRNSRMKLLPAGGLDSAQVVEELQDFRQSAKHLGVSGAFNVNSTSVDAWKALLSGYREAAVAHSENASVQVEQLDAGVSAFPGMSLAGGGAEAASTNLASDSAWAGFMELSDAMIEDLATEIVAQIMTRSAYRGNEPGRNGRPTPALSLGQFINRINVNPNSSDRDLAQGGTIQQAIVAAGINDDLSGLAVTEFETTNFNQTHNPKPVAWGGNAREYYPDPNYSFDVRNVSPLALTQADILQAIGPSISARSDTFTIRAYGDVEDPISGEVLSQVWCEATVQRTTREEDPVNKPNQRLFEVVEFGWLSPEEI